MTEENPGGVTGRVTVDAGVEFPAVDPGRTWVVGAVILDARGEAFAQYRALGRRPSRTAGIWWAAMSSRARARSAAWSARSPRRPAGRVCRVRRFLGVITWRGDDGLGVRHEADYVVEVDGDLDRPDLEWAKHPRFGWFGPGDLDRLTENRAPHDQLVHVVVARALGVTAPD